MNKTGRQVLSLTAEALAEHAGVTPPTLRKAVDELTDDSAPMLRVISGEVQLLQPKTGQSLDELDDEEKLVFFETGSRMRIGMHELLSLESFKRYYGNELPGLDTARVQQDVRCPFHADSTPSMSVNVADGEWFCHACDFGGGMRHFEMRMLETEDKIYAWESIGKKLGVRLSGKKLGKPTTEHFWPLDAQVQRQSCASIKGREPLVFGQQTLLGCAILCLSLITHAQAGLVVALLKFCNSSALRRASVFFEKAFLVHVGFGGIGIRSRVLLSF